MKKKDWEKRFDEVLYGGCVNLEITWGELVDGNPEPLKQFISKLLKQKEKEVRGKTLDDVLYGLVEIPKIETSSGNHVIHVEKVIELLEKLSNSKQNNMKKKCRVCKYVKEGVFPFLNRSKLGRNYRKPSAKGYFIDTEGCTEEDEIRIYYCPSCGKKLSTITY
jgi:hypothetical protein